MTAGEVLMRFSGVVECRISRAGPLGLTLLGRDRDEPVQIAFVCTAPAAFPEQLESAVVMRDGPGTFRIVAGATDRRLEAAGVFAHRDVARVLERAVPPRPPSLARRIFWRAVLALAASPIGRSVLLARRR
jgi:hypothetical protein